MMALSSFCSVKLSDRFSSKTLCLWGIAFVAAAMLLFSLMGHETPIYFICIAMGTSGIGLGLFFSTNMKLIMCNVRKKKEGTGSAIMTCTRTLTTLLGIVLFETLLSSLYPNIIKHSAEPNFPAMNRAFNVVFLVGTALSLASFAVSALMKKNE